MITVHCFDHETGQRRAVTIDGTDPAEAREFCHAIVSAEGPIYRAAIYDRLSTRYIYDTDAEWLTKAVA